MIEDIFSSSKIRKIKPTYTSKIIIDTREKNSLVPTYLIKEGIPYQKEKLEIGDYLISDLIIERKTFNDFLSSFYSKRLINQLTNIKKYPSTFILVPKKDLIESLGIDFNKGVGVRLPKNDFLIKIIKSLNQPIISTSCNLSGQKNLNNYREIISFFNNVSDKPDFLIKFKNIKPKRKASKIFDIRNDENIKKLRF